MATKQKKKTAKKATTKKAAAPEVDQETARGCLSYLKKGGTLGSQRDRLGLSSNAPLRKALRKLLGGREPYEKMMANRPGTPPAKKGSKAA